MHAPRLRLKQPLAALGLLIIGTPWAGAAELVVDVVGVADAQGSVGLPTEPWAVSNNVRPTLRAPRFAEAAFTLEASDTRRIELRLQR